jgi:hypothetical protein
MVMAPRILWLIVLACFVGGCGTMRPARWADAPADSAADNRVLPVVKIGDRVAVERLDRSRVSGHLRAFTSDSVTVETERKVGYEWVHETQVIPRAEILSVKKKQVSLERTLLLAGGAVVGLGVAFVIAVGSTDWHWEEAN